MLGDNGVDVVSSITGIEDGTHFINWRRNGHGAPDSLVEP